MEDMRHGGGLPLQTGPDEQVLPRTGECHIHQVEAFDEAVVVFLQIQVLIDAVAGLFFQDDGEQRNGVVRFVVRRHPHTFRLLDVIDDPVAIGDEDCVERQTL